MHADLLKRWSCGRVSCQNPRNDVPGFIRNWNVVWERILVHFDTSVSGFDIGGFKWRFSYDESVDDDSQRPDVDLVRVTGSALQNLGSDVVGRTANSPLFLSIKIELCSKTEITEFDGHFVIKEEISQFQISVDDPVGVKVFEGVDDLHGVALDFQLVEPLSPLQQFVHTLVVAELQQDVNIFTVFEEMHELSHILVFH